MSLINIFRKPRNKKFRYSPRYSKSNKTNLYGFDSAYSKHRESNSVFDKSNAWDEARLRSRNRSNALFSKTILVIVSILTLIFLYIIDFDLRDTSHNLLFTYSYCWTKFRDDQPPLVK